MIVQCDKCETKFRIADERVTGGGVKVRCSKCAHVFVVRKDPLGAPAGIPGVVEIGGPTVKVSADAMATFAAGSMAPNLSRAPTVPLPQPARSIPPPASTQQVAAALGFGSAPPRAPVLAFTTNIDAQRPPGLPSFPDSTKRELPTFPESPPTNTSNDRFPESRPLSEIKTEQMKLPAKRDPFHDDPFPKIPSSPGFPPPAASDPFPKVGSDPSNPFGKVPTGPKDPFGELGSQPGHNPFSSPDPFGAVAPNEAYAAPAMMHPFADGALAPPRPESNPFQNPPAPGPDLLQRGIAKGDSKPTFFPPPTDLGKPKSDRDGIPVDAADHDPFADIEINAPSAFDDDNFNSAPPPPKPALEPLGRLNPGGLISIGDRSEVSHAKTAVAAAFRAKEEEDENAVGWWPTLLGGVVGLLIALFVFPGLVGDWMDLRIGTELIQPKKLLPESLEDVNPMGARVTSYDGRNGARMLVVSGSAHNEGKEKVDNIQAVVLMMEGDEIVERRRALVGVTLDEATLAGLESAFDLEAAYRSARLAAPVEQLEIAPGANSRFVVVFPEIPEAIETRKFRVEFVKAPVESAKKTEPTP